MRSIAIVGLIGGVVALAFSWAVVAGSRAFGRRLGGHLATDVVVCCRLTAETIVRRATRHLPASERDRYEQEWLAELDELQRTHRESPALSLVVFAMRVLIRARTTGKVWAQQRSTPAAADADASSESDPGHSWAARIASYASDYFGDVVTFVSTLAAWALRRASSVVSTIREDLRFWAVLVSSTAAVVFITEQIPPRFASLVSLLVTALGLLMGVLQLRAIRALKRQMRGRR